MWTLKITWLLLVLALAAACLTAGSWWTLALLLTVVLIPVLSLLGNLAARKRLKLRLETPGNLGKNQPGAMTLVLKNGSRLPMARIRCRLRLENRLTGAKTEQTVLAACLPKGTASVSLEFCGGFAGRVEITPVWVKLYDCFGVWPVRVPCTAAGVLTVQPDMFVQKIRISAADGCPDDSEVYAPNRPGYDLSETYQLREYREGDHPRQIHWKLTGKLDRLVIREPSLPITRSVVVFWERTVPKPESPRDADLLAEIVVSACRALVEQQVPFTVIWNDTKTDVCVLQEIRDLEDLAALLPRLLGAGSRVGGVTGAEALLGTVGESVYSHILYVASEAGDQAGLLEQLGRLTVLSLDGPGTRIDRENFAAQLLELEI